MNNNKHAWLTILLIIILGSLFFYFLKKQIIDIGLFSALITILLASTGIIYQTGENRKIQDLQNKREVYASLMEALELFKAKRDDKGKDETHQMTRLYFRSWAEISDSVYEKLLLYLNSYRKWGAEQNNAMIEHEEIEAFDALTLAIRKEINPKSKSKFKVFQFNSGIK